MVGQRGKSRIRPTTGSSLGFVIVTAVALVLGSAVAPVALADEPLGVIDVPGSPTPHGDTPPPGLPPEVHPETDVERWAAIAIARERADGTHVPAFYTLNEMKVGVTENELVQEGLPVVAREQVPKMTPEDIASIAWSYEEVQEVLDNMTREGTDEDGVGTQSHPEPPIGDFTSLPVTAYADGAEQDEGSWYDDVVSSFDAADSVLTADPDVHIYRFFLMTTGTPVHDVSTYCHMQDTAEYEEGFAPHVGVFVGIFSPGDVEGNWGVALDGPVTHQIYASSSWDYCTSSSRSPPFIPSTYTKHRPLTSLGNMQYLTAHEFGHQFTMRHRDAQCWDGGWNHYHKTIEAFTSASDNPCGNTDWNQHWHWDYSATSDSRMWDERQDWTDCYNNGC